VSASFLGKLDKFEKGKTKEKERISHLRFRERGRRRRICELPRKKIIGLEYQSALIIK